MIWRFQLILEKIEINFASFGECMCQEHRMANVQMSKWAKQYSYQLTAEQIEAVENNDCSKFKTTSGGKETMSQIWKEQPFGGCFGQKYAEAYDEASWFRARCAFLEYRNSELEEEEEELGKPCDMCKKPFKSEEEYDEEEDEDWASAPVHICDGCAEQYQANWDEIAAEQYRLALAEQQRSEDAVPAEIVSDSD